jgi:hypothetical protein
MRLRRDPELLALDDFLVGILEQRLQRLLANGIAESLPYQRSWRLAGPNPGSRTDDAYRRAVRSSASCTTVTGTDTSRRRSTPSFFFVLISICIVTES